MRPGRAITGQHWLLSLGLWAAVTLALLQLPPDDLPTPWLLALLAPAATLALLQQLPLRRGLAMGLVVTMQVCLCVLALRGAGALGRPAALAGSILWPMAFVAVRRRDADVPLGLFLSFCVLLVGIILRGAEPLLIGGYVLAGAVVLRSEARLAVLRLIAPERQRTVLTQLLPHLSLALACGVAVMALQRAQEVLPTPGRLASNTPQPDTSHRRGIGLSDRFDLAGGGTLSDLRGERLVQVECRDGEVPDDLYLRSGFFDLPGLDDWKISGFEARLRDTTERAWQVRQPVPKVEVHHLGIERLGSGRTLVFVPVGVTAVQGLEQLHGSLPQEWFRQTPASEAAPYEVSFQDLRWSVEGRPVDARWREAGLTQVGPEFDRKLFEPLQQHIMEPGLDADAAAKAIAGELWRNYRYTLIEPTGPHGHALLDFLFSCHAGYCMHFASAAAILLRLQGIPCRIGVGLFGGEADGGPRHRVYGSQHAHAWVEIPYQDLGWVVFDPTPPAQRGHRLPQEDRAPAAAPGSGVDGDDYREPGFTERLAAVLTAPLPWLLALALAVLSTLLPGRRRAAAKTAMPANVRAARRLLLRVLRELAARGLPRRRQQTLEAYEAWLLQTAGPQPALQRAFAAYQQVRFGDRPLDADREGLLQKAFDAARALPRRALTEP